MSIPYQSATSGDGALAELQKILGRFGCGTFGTMTDVERGCTIIQFRWRGRSVSLEASWQGYAAAWLKENPYTHRTRCTQNEHSAKAIKQAKIAVCSILRDWVKGQITAVECGIMSFEAAFMAHMMLPTGERLVDRVEREIVPQLTNG